MLCSLFSSFFFFWNSPYPLIFHLRHLPTFFFFLKPPPEYLNSSALRLIHACSAHCQRKNIYTDLLTCVWLPTWFLLDWLQTCHRPRRRGIFFFSNNIDHQQVFAIIMYALATPSSSLTPWMVTNYGELRQRVISCRIFDKRKGKEKKWKQIKSKKNWLWKRKQKKNDCTSQEDCNAVPTRLLFQKKIIHRQNKQKYISQWDNRPPPLKFH